VKTEDKRFKLQSCELPIVLDWFRRPVPM